MEHDSRNARHGAHRGDDGGEQEEEDEEREDFGEVEGISACLVLLFGLMSTVEGEHEGDGQDGQRAGEFDDGCDVQRIVSGVHAVPGRGCRGDRGRVVDRRTGKQAEAVLGQTERLTEGWENQSGEDVKEEDDRDGLRDLLVVGLDDRRGGCDGRTAADGRADTDQRGDVAGNVQDTAQDKGDNERNRDGGDDDGQGLGADVGDIGQVQSESEQNDRVLQDFLEVKPIPSAARPLSCQNREMTMPSRMAKTGPPMTGKA